MTAGSGPLAVTELAPGVRVAFTSRHGGVSTGPYAAGNLGAAVGDEPAAVAANRDRLARQTGARGIAWMHQVHGTAVAAVAEPTSASHPPPEADAQFTATAGLALAVLVADCAPVLLADPVRAIVGAAHAGRAGLARGVVPALVTAMTRAGADAGRMHAVIGPVICARCYEVPASLRDEVAAQVPGSASESAAGTPSIDIAAGLAGQLARSGVRQVRADPRCPAQDGDLYSYRRDGRTGRFAGLIWLAA